jgi:hypothetical protein
MAKEGDECTDREIIGLITTVCEEIVGLGIDR